MSLRVQDVFKVSGVPTYTFVRPSAFTRLRVALDTPGRGVVIEGPSGIGKSTAVSKVLEDLGVGDKVTMLSARDVGDVEYIAHLPRWEAPAPSSSTTFTALRTVSRAPWPTS